MGKRAALIVAACGAAAVLLALALRIGGPAPKVQTRPITDAPGAEAFTGTAPSADGGAGRPGVDSIAGVEEYRYRRQNRNGQVVELFGKTIQPLPGGRSEVELPGARVFLTDRRVLEMRADHGTFDLPDNQPRGGEFQRNVVLTLFESPAGRPPELAEQSPDIRLRIYLDDATFDLELGQVESDGSVHLTGPGVDFVGEGLSLTYNELRRRIDRLEITRGRSLRFNPATKSAGDPGDDEKPQTRPQTQPDDEPVQFYRAVLENDVRIVSKDLRIDAAALTVIFSLGDGARRGPIFEPSDPGAAVPVRSRFAAAPTGHSAALWWLIFAADPASTPPPEATVLPADPHDRTLAAPTVDDVTITWSGKLIVEPEENPPAELTTNDDVLVKIAGSPVTIATAKKDSATCALLTYATPGRVLRLDGSDAFPLLLDSPALGELRGPGLVIEQDKAVGQITGAGSLTTRRKKPAGLIEALEQDKSKPGNTAPRDLDVTWNDRVDLTFFADDSDTNNLVPANLKALKDASFRGGVKAVHPQFDLHSDLLVLALTPPAAGNDQALESISAVGSVAVVTRSDKPDEQLTLTSDQLAVTTQTDDRGTARPAHLIAKGNVAATQPGRVLRSGVIDVTLAEDGAEPAFRKIAATDGVTIELAENNVKVAADSLLTEAGSDQLELFGKEGVPATLANPDGTLAGRYIVLDQVKQSATVVGAGTFEFLQPERVGAGDKQARVTVGWTESMRFDNLQGQAQFTGGVVCNADRGNDTSQLKADDLRIEFTPTAEGDAAGNGRTVKEANAVGKAVFVAEQWADHAGGRLASRLRIAGDHLHFDGSAEQVQVLKAGTMLVEDYRAEDAKPQALPGGVASGGAKFAGRGATLFTWGGQMTLDLRNNDMELRDQVQMIHKPSSADGKASPMQLDCRYFLADVRSSGGMGAWMETEKSGAKTPQPELVKVQADGAVRVLSEGRTVTTDHLLYTGADQTVLLSADVGKQTEMTEAGGTDTYSAEAFKWDLARNRIEILRPGTGRMPVK